MFVNETNGTETMSVHQEQEPHTIQGDASQATF